MSFKSRLIDLSFQLSEDKFGDKLGDTVVYSGLKCEASINNVGGASLNSLQLRVFGMSESSMNKLSTLGLKVLTTRRNMVTVAASNLSGGMTQAFQGTIAEAWIDYRGAPDVSFNVIAYSGFWEKVKAIAVNSYKGSTDVAAIISSLAKSIGFSFKNNGVTTQLSSPYFAGSAITQIKDCARHAKIGCDIGNGSVEIWPSGGQRDDATILVSSENGLVGYPVFISTGLNIQSEFNQDILRGRKIVVKSSIPQACGDWYCQVARHEIASQTTNGPWFTYAQMAKEGIYVR